MKRFRDFPAEMPLVSPYTREHKAGDGKATYKTASAAARAAEEAKRAAQSEAKLARDIMEQTTGWMRQQVEQCNRAAAEMRQTAARAVATCAAVALLEILGLVLVISIWC